MLAAIDILTAPSHAEGMSNVILEAMAAGIPVVATRVGGTPELIEDGASGLLVGRRAPDRLAEAIDKLIEEPDLRVRLGRAGQERVRSLFSIEHTAALTKRLYLDLLTERRLRRMLNEKSKSKEWETAETRAGKQERIQAKQAQAIEAEEQDEAAEEQVGHQL